MGRRRGGLFSRIGDAIAKNAEARRERKMLKLTSRLDRKEQRQDRKDYRLEAKYNLRSQRSDNRTAIRMNRTNKGSDVGGVINSVAPHMYNFMGKSVDAAAQIAPMLIGGGAVSSLGGMVGKAAPSLSTGNDLKTAAARIGETFSLTSNSENVEKSNKFNLQEFIKTKPMQFGGILVGFFSAVGLILWAFKKNNSSPRKRRR